MSHKQRHCLTCQQPMVRIRHAGSGLANLKCQTPDCLANKHPPVYIQHHTDNELFPRKGLNDFEDQDDPLFENLIRLYEDTLETID